MISIFELPVELLFSIFEYANLNTGNAVNRYSYQILSKLYGRLFENAIKNKHLFTYFINYPDLDIYFDYSISVKSEYFIRVDRHIRCIAQQMQICAKGSLTRIAMEIADTNLLRMTKKISNLPVHHLNEADIARRWLHDNPHQLAQITRLPLSNCGLTQLPPEIALFRNLTYLCISFNQLEGFCPEIQFLQSLERIDGECNKICKLSNELLNLKNLKKLYLARNKIRILPHKFYHSNLERVDLAINNIESVSVELIKNSTLQHLFFYKNPNLKNLSLT